MFREYHKGPIHAKNRIVRAAINDHLGSRDGYVTDAQVELFDRLGAGGAGTILTGHFAVAADGRVDPFQCTAADDSRIPGMSRIAEAIHRHGALAVMQLSHGGSGISAEMGDLRVGPSARDGIRELTVDEIRQIIRQFGEAAVRVQKAGFDGAEVHIAHGYLLADFVDDTRNHRTDAYGGDNRRRFRICREILETIREKCGETFLIYVKVNSNNTEQDPAYDRIFDDYVTYLDELCVDAIEISGRDFSKRDPKEDAPYYLKACAAAKEITDIPIVPVGGFRNRSMVQEALDAGMEFVSMGRSLISEEELVNKMQSGTEEFRCIRCNRCFRVYKEKHVRCVFHKEEVPQLAENFGRNA